MFKFRFYDCAHLQCDLQNKIHDKNHYPSLWTTAAKFAISIANKSKGFVNRVGHVAQLVEQGSVNTRVVGFIPTWVQ